MDLRTVLWWREVYLCDKSKGSYSQTFLADNLALRLLSHLLEYSLPIYDWILY
jgi:hypothetical protein